MPGDFYWDDEQRLKVLKKPQLFPVLYNLLRLKALFSVALPDYFSGTRTNLREFLNQHRDRDRQGEIDYCR
jgi:hypothetical protein